MSRDRCINCKSEIIDFVEKNMAGFKYAPPTEPFRMETSVFASHSGYGNISGSTYNFVKENEDGSFYQFQVERCFKSGIIFISCDISASFQQYYWDKRPCTEKERLDGNYIAYESSKVSPCPWILVPNTKEGLDDGLGQLKTHFEEHLLELYGKYHKKLLKNKIDRIINHYVRNLVQHLDDPFIYKIYESIDELVEQYHAEDKNKLPFLEQISFCAYSYGKMSPEMNGWIEEIIDLAKKEKVKEISHSHVIGCFLLIFHDTQKIPHPNIIKSVATSRKNEER